MQPGCAAEGWGGACIRLLCASPLPPAKHACSQGAAPGAGPALARCVPACCRRRPARLPLPPSPLRPFPRLASCSRGRAERASGRDVFVRPAKKQRSRDGNRLHPAAQPAGAGACSLRSLPALPACAPCPCRPGLVRRVALSGRWPMTLSGRCQPCRRRCCRRPVQVTAFWARGWWGPYNG